MSTTRIVRCPQCGKSSRYDINNPDRPFCSARCKTSDIARWAEESYRIPVQEEDPNEDDTLEALRRAEEDKESF